jgi:flagellar biosynthetic protein FlhB
MPAGDRHSKTEKPTAKKKKDSRKKGQVARSPDIGGWFSLLILTFVLPAAFGYAESKVLAIQALANQVMAHPTIPGALTVLSKGLENAFLIILPFAGIIAIIGLLASVAQVGFVFSAKGITPQFSKLNPIHGIKRLFSVRGLWELAKTVIKLGVIALFATRDIIGLMHTLMGSQPVAMGPLIDYAGAELLGFVRTLAVIGFLLGLADFAFQRHKLSADLKMTKQEVKDEMRESQGDPHVKGQIRGRQRAMSRLRMMAEVSRADLIITNPTHYAVALKYDRTRSSAPRVVAKGSDEVAARIREEATRHGVPIVEDPPLARAVYGACEIHDEIPEALYMAVARLLAYVYALSPALKSARPIHRRPASALVA